MSTDLALIDTPDAKALAVNAERARMMAGGRDALPRQYRDNPAALLVAFEYADALNLPRITVLTGIHVVDGRPTASADLIGALVRKAGHRLRVTGDETFAEAQIVRADDPTFEPKPIRWDLDRAHKAGLLGKKGPWQSYPGAMMRARAITEAARMWASESLFGVIYTPDELGVPVDSDGQPIIDGTVEPDRPAVTRQQAPPPQPTPEPAPPATKPLVTDQQLEAILTQITQAESQDDLDAILHVVATVDLGQHGPDLRALWNARAEQLAAPPAEPDQAEAQGNLQDVLDATAEPEGQQ